MKNKFKKWDVIEILWIDSCHVNGWNKDNFDYDKADLEFRTVGYFLKETKYSIVVVQSSKRKTKDEGTSIDALMEIPKVAIEKMKKL
jgi:hypothetical protein